MIKFEEHDGLIFKMLDEPTPLTPETEMPCLVRLIQDDSPMGLHNKDLHGFDPERLTPRICTEVIDVNDLSDPNRGSARCDGLMSIQYYRYELIGTPVAEGSAEWALYQHKQGLVLSNPKHGLFRQTFRLDDTAWFCISIYPDGWITEPKPLLADTGIGDIVKTNLGDWLQIVDTPCLRFGHDECYRTHDGLYWDEYGVCDVDSTYRLVAVEPLAPEGTAEWAWQMLKLQKPVSHPAEGELQDTDYTKEGFVRCMAKTGWQLYEPKPEPDKEDMHLRSGKDNPERQDFCHMYEPQPESQYKVGDWVELNVYNNYQGQIKKVFPAGMGELCGTRIHRTEPTFLITGLSGEFHYDTIARKLSPSEVVIHIGCLSGTVDDLSYAVDGRFWLIGKATERCPVGMFALLYDEMLDTPTRKIVENLINAQEEEK